MGGGGWGEGGNRLGVTLSCQLVLRANGRVRNAERSGEREGLRRPPLSGDAGGGASRSLSLFTSQVQEVSSPCGSGGLSVPETMAAWALARWRPGAGSEETWGVRTAELNAKPNTCGDTASPGVTSAD